MLAYFEVSKLGEPPIDGKTDTNPEGLTDAYEKWSLTVSEILLAGGLSCKVVFIFNFLCLATCKVFLFMFIQYKHTLMISCVDLCWKPYSRKVSISKADVKKAHMGLFCHAYWSTS